MKNHLKQLVNRHMSAEQIKHLEFIQAVITRLGNNGFLAKGWAISLIAALIALASNNGTYIWALVFLGCFCVALFAYIDSYYLQQERCFRALYNDAIAQNSENEISLFSMDIREYLNNNQNKSYEYCQLLSCLYSKTIIRLYGSLIVVVLILGVILSCCK